MNQILDSIVIALQAIWANKLRSFMTVLGNIVAVTSIVTVVSLIQGMNSMVSSAIVDDVGADSFIIQRRPPVRSLEDEERTRNNPNITLAEADAIRAFSGTIDAVAAQAQRRSSVTYRNLVIDGVQTGVDYTYMHLRDAALVDEGERVRTGQLIGYVGQTGRASGCHLHFEMWKAPGWYDGGSPFDPLPSLLAWDKTS